jgi:hypothetical protein
MTKLIAAAALLAVLAGGAAAESFPLAPTDGSAPGYRVSADHAPVMTPEGVPAFPQGTQLTVEADGASSFEVFLMTPSSLDDSCRRHRWTGTLTRPGGYKLQFGRERSRFMSQLDFVVSPDTEELARTTPYDFGFR